MRKNYYKFNKIMKNKLIALSGSVLSFMPLGVALAQTPGAGAGCAGGVQPGTISSVICKIADILDLLIPIVIVLGVLLFVWGVVQYVIADDEEAKKAGKDRMIYGILGLVVIVALWGLVGIVTRSLGLEGGAVINYPQISY